MQLRSYIIRDELCGSNALRFAEQLGAASFSDVAGVELLFARSSRIDVSGIAVIVRIYSRLSAMNRQFILRDAPSHVRSQFAQIGLLALLVDEPRPSVFAAASAAFARLSRAQA